LPGDQAEPLAGEPGREAVGDGPGVWVGLEVGSYSLLDHYKDSALIPNETTNHLEEQASSMA
jgi:hypothetical protein